MPELPTIRFPWVRRARYERALRAGAEADRIRREMENDCMQYVMSVRQLQDDLAATVDEKLKLLSELQDLRDRAAAAVDGYPHVVRSSSERTSPDG